jgi:hypothetical protein
MRREEKKARLWAGLGLEEYAWEEPIHRTVKNNTDHDPSTVVECGGGMVAKKFYDLL